MRTLLMSTVAALFAAGAAYAEDVRVLIDTDGDGQVTVEEWDSSRADFGFGEWDTNADSMLSREEYEARLEMQDDADSFGTWDDRYSAWDTDADNMLSAEEYNAGLWSTFDEDGDSMWSQDETAAWEEDEMRYDATRMGAEVSAPGEAGGEAGAAGGAAGGATGGAAGGTTN